MDAEVVNLIASMPLTGLDRFATGTFVAFGRAGRIGWSFGGSCCPYLKQARVSRRVISISRPCEFYWPICCGPGGARVIARSTGRAGAPRLAYHKSADALQ